MEVYRAIDGWKRMGMRPNRQFEWTLQYFVRRTLVPTSIDSTEVGKSSGQDAKLARRKKLAAEGSGI
jgi:hypothetical protein